ncbi:MAG: IPT/TIG domain-containing protein [Pseudolysinimonas sp.]
MRQTESGQNKGNGKGESRFARWGFKALAALAVATTAVFTVGVLPANATAGDDSHATGAFLSGSMLTNTQLLAIGSSAADNDGTQATQTDQDNLNATVLNALNITVPGGVQVPLSIADVGALGSFAQAKNDGSSLGASGLVANDGSIGVGAVGAGGVPAPMTLDLADTLGGTLAAEIADLSLELQSLSASAESTAGGAPVGDYEIVGGKILLTSNTIKGLSASLSTLAGNLQGSVDALAGSSGLLSTAVQGIGLLSSLGLGSASVSVTADIQGAITPLLGVHTLNGVTVDLSTGAISVDLAAVNGGSLNGLAPNTELLSSAVLTAVTTAVTTIVSQLVTAVTTAVTTAVDDAAVNLDLTLTLLGTSVLQVQAVGTLSTIVTDPNTITITTLSGLPLGLTKAAVQTALGVVVNPVLNGALATFVAGLQTGVVDPVANSLSPALAALNTVLSLIANGQNPSPPVAGQLFKETALEVTLLAQGPVTSLVELDIASATVGPNTTGVAPVITGLTPISGPESGGTAVTITGTGFGGTTGVLFGATPAASFTVDSDTQITAITPPHVPALVDVTLVHPAGASNPGAFTFTPLIAITNINPNGGPTAGGTAVTITGVCFTGATGVTFGGIAGTSFVVVNDTTITVTSPAHAVGPVDVLVHGSVACGGDKTFTNGFTYVAPGVPTITGMVPDNGPESGGTAVTITGTGFTGASGVTFDGVPATSVVVVNSTTITAVSPAHAAGLVGVVVQHPTNGNSIPFDFTYTPLISVTTIAPTFGPTAGGTVVTITGTCFTGATGVLFDGNAGSSFSVNPAGTVITVTTPPGAAGFVDVTVQGAAICGGDTVVTDGFEYISATAPVITGLNPNSGPYTGGTPVTITGTGFTGATGVTFGGVAATNFVVVNSTTITVTSPPHAVGPADVIVQHPNGPSAPQTFTFLPATTVTNVSPPSGPEAGGTAVTITGLCFTGATGVRFGTTPATSFVVVNATTITAVAPPGVGTVDVTVIGSVACGDGTDPGAFTYIKAGLAFTGAVVLPSLLGALLLIVVGLALAIGRKRRDGIA